MPDQNIINIEMTKLPLVTRPALTAQKVSLGMLYVSYQDKKLKIHFTHVCTRS